MNWMEAELTALARESRERKLRDIVAAEGEPGYLMCDGKILLNLSSNDYLGLSQHPAIAEAMRESLAAGACGSGASRLVTGNWPPYRHLEEELADWQQTEGALVFANGYMANVGAIASLVGRGDVVFSDRLNHASIVDGIVLSRAEHIRYRHGDIEHLRHVMARYAQARRKLIVTDVIFSMDGDAAPLEELVRLKSERDAMLMVDEAHSEGVYGARGAGLCHALGVQREVDIRMGTFSKAFGLYGAHICGSATLIRWLTNKARPFIYSTAMPPTIVAGVRKALELVQSEQCRRERLIAASARFRRQLTSAGFRVGSGDSPIVPVIVGGNETALRFADELENAGVAAVAIRPPTVPEGTARIRFSLSAAHRDTELDDAIVRIRQVGNALGVIG